jgi:hypothetical protein
MNNVLDYSTFLILNIFKQMIKQRNSDRDMKLVTFYQIQDPQYLVLLRSANNCNSIPIRIILELIDDTKFYTLNKN